MLTGLVFFLFFSGRHKNKVQELANHLPTWTQVGELQQNMWLGGLLPSKVETLPWAHVPLWLLRRGWATWRPSLPGTTRDRPPPPGLPSPSLLSTLPHRHPTFYQSECGITEPRSTSLTYSPRLPALLPLLLPLHILLSHWQQGVGTQADEPVPAITSLRWDAGLHEDVLSKSDSVATRRIPQVRGGVSEWDATRQSEKTKKEDNRHDPQRGRGALVFDSLWSSSQSHWFPFLRAMSAFITSCCQKSLQSTQNLPIKPSSSFSIAELQVSCEDSEDATPSPASPLLLCIVK